MEMTDVPNIWTDGSKEDHPVVGFEVSGVGVYFPAPEEAMRGSVWGVAEEYGDAKFERCRAPMPVLGPLQSVQRAEFWGCNYCGEYHKFFSVKFSERVFFIDVK